VIENDEIPHYFTEKWADALLCNSFPIYMGCPNIADYFSSGAFKCASFNDWHNFEDLILNLLDVRDTHYDMHFDELINAKKNYMENYSFFPLLGFYLDQLELNKQNEARKVNIEPLQLRKVSHLANRIKRYYYGRKAQRLARIIKSQMYL
tara:strand:+ start:508 stop:957 length:450 start_codon:yes stop_codon:yes gene_type:complete